MAKYTVSPDKLNHGKEYSWGGLHQHLTPEDFESSHHAVVNYWQPYNDIREENYDMRRGNQWSEDELKIMRRKGKAAVVFNKIISATRTIIGTFIQNKYDMVPAPFEPNDQGMADVIKQRYVWNAHHSQVRYKDPDLIEEAVVGGDGWQESYVEVVPGQKPRIIVRNQNNFAIYPDPNSTDLIERSDCNFIDRVSWVTPAELANRFPEHRKDILNEFSEYDLECRSHYEADKRYAERHHENQNMRNGRIKVIERFYKVTERTYRAVSPDRSSAVKIGVDPDGTKRDYAKREFPEYDIFSKKKEYLNLAIICPSWNKNKFLYNGRYHCQPRDPVSKRIIFPLIQLVCEKLSGDTNGYVEFMRGPQKLINSMMANKLHSAKHAVNTSLVGDPSAFTGEQQADIEKNHSDGDRLFWTRPGKDPNRVLSLMPQGHVNKDTDDTLDFANAFHEEVSAAPPAARGISEGNVPGVLNQQRIEQAFIQILQFTENYKAFLTTRAKLWCYYDRRYSTEEETFRVIEKKNPEDEDWVTINKWVTDAYGNIKKANDMQAAEFDIVFEDSWKSASVREKVRQQIIQLQQSPAVQKDPVLNTYLTLYFLKLTDAPEDLKNYVKDHSSIVKQWEQSQHQQQAQAGHLENIERLQGIADREAGAMGGFSPGAAQAQPQQQAQPAAAGGF